MPSIYPDFVQVCKDGCIVESFSHLKGAAVSEAHKYADELNKAENSDEYYVSSYWEDR